ncbi:DUF5681 domain-containing protein [Sphingobium fuliginis]|uniref:DUF5681 domain-containing protein n=1 Tax=Sphingobium fuliginis ATCC 27551 TaxID=1208342 RepID=A0A5B8CHK2_SPHSA|nr:DUF5681 domain-containing protein [Sphingobium fuliginis]QDC37746.1 hypothetical protein FIL70_11455 [Sphingobium fuliginis ATCC 27551]
MADDYEVGYGKPPAATRFKPGQSGNPNGRKPKPKAETKLKPVLKNVLEEPVKIGGRSYTPMEVMVRNLVNKAMKGDDRAIRAVMELEQKLGLDKPEGRSGVLKITRVPPELRELWAKMQQAKFRGEDPEGLAALDANLPEKERGRY